MEQETLKVTDLETSIRKIVTFLEPYLLLANAHATDFITRDFWNTLIPASIRKELAELSETELRGLSQTYLKQLGEDVSLCTAGFVKNSSIDGSCTAYTGLFIGEPSVSKELVLPTEENEGCRITSMAACRTAKLHGDSKHENDISNKTEEYYLNSGQEAPLKPLLIDWKHKTLQEFCQEAKTCILDAMGLVRSYKDLTKEYENEKLFVGTFMNEKKSHEIERMAAVCKTIYKKSGADLVIDFGSGKGYLGSYLSLQYDIPVLGIDAVSINTTSAARRTDILTKQWNGLMKNKELEVMQVKLTKREKKLLKESQSSDTPSHTQDIPNGNKTKSNRYIPVTVYIEHFTDLNKLVADNFPEFCPAFKEILDISVSCVKEGSDTFDKSSQACDTIQVNNRNIQTNLNNTPYNKDDLDPGIPIMDKVVNGELQKLSLYGRSTVNKDTESVTKNYFNKQKDGAVPEIKSLLTGLHTCGNLASTSLKLFVDSPLLNTLCNVGCCYHLLTEEFLVKRELSTECSNTGVSFGFPLSTILKQKNFHLGQTARNLASQSMHRLADCELQGRKFFPRAILEVLLEKIGMDCSDRQGRSLRGLEQKSKSLQEFIMKTCTKLGISEKVDDTMISEVLQEYAAYEQKLAAFFQLRTVLAPCIESLIILDRACYLLEQDVVRDVCIVQMFDPVVSPRCYGIIANKY